jgi:hypothetical protein
MVITVSLIKKSAPMIRYNEKKRKNGKASIIYSTMIPENTNFITRTMDSVGYLNHATNLEYRFCHIQISLSPKDRKVDDREFEKIGREVLDRLGLDPKQRHLLLYTHLDEPHHHSHAILSRSDFNGRTAELKHYKIKCQIIARELEKKYGLICATDKNLKDNGIRESQYLERAHQVKTNRQSSIQQLKDIVNFSLENSATFTEYVHDLQRNNIEILFRLAQNKLGGISVGVSYGLNVTKKPIVLRDVALPSDLLSTNSDKLLDELLNQGYSFLNPSEKCYKGISNRILRNDNTYPIARISDVTAKAKTIGPAAQWLGLIKRYPRLTEAKLFGEVLKSLGNEKKVIKLKASELIASEGYREKIAMIGVKELNYGVIQEALDSGINFRRLFEEKKKTLGENEIANRLKALAFIQQTTEETDMLFEISLIKDRFDKALKYGEDSQDTKSAFEYAIGIVNTSSILIEQHIANSHEMRFEDYPNYVLDYRWLEQDLVLEVEADLQHFLMNAAETELNMAIELPEVSLLGLRSSMDFLTMNQLNINPELVLKLESRIAEEIVDSGKSEMEIYEEINSSIKKYNHDDFKFLLQMQRFNKTLLEDEEIENIIDPRIKRLAEEAKMADRDFHAVDLLNLQRELVLADRAHNTDRLLELMPIKELDFSNIDIRRYLGSDLDPVTYELEERIEHDKRRLNRSSYLVSKIMIEVDVSKKSTESQHSQESNTLNVPKTPEQSFYPKRKGDPSEGLTLDPW